MMKFVRVMHCPQCEKRKAPLRGDSYWTWNDSEQLFTNHHVYSPDIITGFTPHLIKKQRMMENGNVHITATCLIEDCGVFITMERKIIEATEVILPILHSHNHRIKYIGLSKKDWNALLLFLGTEYDAGYNGF